LKILITGASGFIGSSLVRSLTEEHTVYAVVRKKKKFVGNPQVNFIEVDLSRKDFVEELPSGINTVLHLAQSSRYRDFPDGVEDMIAVNISSTGLLLDWARRSGVKHFVFSSTANVYAQTGEKFTEQSKTAPNSFYGASKLAAEQLVVQYAQYFSIDILRLFTVYGPGQKGMLIPQIIQKIRSGEEIYLASKVGIYLTPIYIDDLVNIISHLMKTDDDLKLRIMNVCGNEKVSLGQIVRNIEKILNVSTPIRVTNDIPMNFIGSNELLFREIDALDFTRLMEGLVKTVKA
jgi:UDP-glucose 4-epimerase